MGAMVDSYMLSLEEDQDGNLGRMNAIMPGPLPEGGQRR